MFVFKTLLVAFRFYRWPPPAFFHNCSCKWSCPMCSTTKSSGPRRISSKWPLNGQWRIWILKWNDSTITFRNPAAQNLWTGHLYRVGWNSHCRSRILFEIFSVHFVPLVCSLDAMNWFYMAWSCSYFSQRPPSAGYIRNQPCHLGYSAFGHFVWVRIWR